MTINNPSIKDDEGCVTLRIPNLFVDIMAGDYVVSPHYQTVKPKSDAWLDELYSRLSQSIAPAYVEADLCLLSATWVPHGSAEALRLVTDFNHWGFPWDDQFDEGHLKSDYMAAIKEVTKSMGVLDEEQPPIAVDENPYRHAYQSVWLRFKEQTTANQQERFRIRQRDYMMGCLAQTAWASGGYQKLSLEQYMEYRRSSAGVASTFPLIEALSGVDLGRHVTEHPAVVACETAMVDILILHNDLLSLRRDLAFDTQHNVILRLQRDQDMSMQEAVDKVGQMLDDSFKAWHTNRARIPKWDELTDNHVAKLLDVWRIVGIGALYWSFATGRYMGEEDGLEARTKGLMRLPKMG